MILDTNALSAIVDGDPQIEFILQKQSFLALPLIVLGEYRYGIAQSKYRADYESWLDTYLKEFILLSIDTETTSHYSDIRLELKKAGSPIPVNDLWIAAIVKQHQFPLLSQDAHFDKVSGLKRVTWSSCL